MWFLEVLGKLGLTSLPLTCFTNKPEAELFINTIMNIDKNMENSIFYVRLRLRNKKYSYS